MDEKNGAVKVRLGGVSGWDHLPFTQRNPEQTCATCFYVSRERAGPADIMGTAFCRFGPKHVTSFPQPNGSAFGVAANPAVDPHNWCYQWWPRAAGDPRLCQVTPELRELLEPTPMQS